MSSLTEIWPTMRQETSYGDIAQRPGEESRVLLEEHFARTSCIDRLNRDLTL